MTSRRIALARPLCLLASLLLAPTLVGCGGLFAERAPSTSGDRGVRFVGQAPAQPEWKCVGRVDGIAPPTDFVAAAHDARVDIKSKAARLGATVVKIDHVRLPSHHSKKPAVLLTGRAYRRVDRHPDERPRARRHSRAS